MASILVVDDSPVIQRLLQHTLRRVGYAVTVASSGVEALAQLREGRFDLVIADLSMPDIDGLTLLRTIRSDPQHKDLPLLMLTASGQDQDRIDARAAGASAFLTKPASSQDLIATVSELIGGVAA